MDDFARSAPNSGHHLQRISIADHGAADFFLCDFSFLIDRGDPVWRASCSALPSSYPVVRARHWVSYTLASAILAAGYGPAMPQQASRSAAEAPTAWREFSARLKAECEKAIQGDDGTGRRLQAALQALRRSSPERFPLRVVVSVWIDGVGGIERVSFQPLPTEQATADLKIILSRASPGTPPPDMLQPVRLMLSLAPRQ